MSGSKKLHAKIVKIGGASAVREALELCAEPLLAANDCLSREFVEGVL